jgi:D-glycero-D-manno-heptose 1,7-bisphosphate phosphatase
MTLKLAASPLKGDRIVLLDRDGVINEDSPDYILSKEAWKPLKNSIEAIARLCYAGYRIVVVSNQSAIGRGYIDIDMLHEIHAVMQGMVA